MTNWRDPVASASQILHASAALSVLDQWLSVATAVTSSPVAGSTALALTMVFITTNKRAGVY